MAKSFFDALLSNEGWGALGPITQEVAFEDDAGNKYGYQGNLIAKGVAPDQPRTFGETALGMATAPAKITTSLLGSLSPYGEEGWRVPPMLTEAADAISAPGKAYYDGMSQEDLQRTAMSAAGFAMGGGAPAMALERSIAARGGSQMSTADHLIARYKSMRHGDEPAATGKMPTFDFGPMTGNDLQNFGYRIDGSGNILTHYPGWGEDTFGAMSGPNRLSNDARTVKPRLEAVDPSYADINRRSIERFGVGYEGLTPEQTRHIRDGAPMRPKLEVIDGGLFSNASKEASALPLAGALNENPVRSYHGTRYDVRGKFKPSDDGLLGPGVYSSPNTSVAELFAGHNRGHIDNPIMNFEYGKMFPFDVAQPIATEADWMRVLANIEGAGPRVDQARSVAIKAQEALANEGFKSVKAGDTINSFKQDSITSPLTGETLFSNASKEASMLPIANSLAQGEGKTGITAYHGSPHDFDKFDISKIGTGEGAQAYGHGLYFAESEGVAKSYSDTLSANGLGKLARGWLRQNGGDFDKTIDYLRGRAEHPEIVASQSPFAVNTRQALAELEQAKAAGTQKGHMYQVRINADPNDFLDWDKPLSQQSEKARNAVSTQFKPNDPDPAVNARLEQLLSGDWQGHSLMSALDTIAENEGRGGASLRSWGSGASEKLREAGINGIKYLDQTSRAAGEGSRNYVVFNPDIIEILKKYGLLVPGAGFGADAFSQSEQY